MSGGMSEPGAGAPSGMIDWDLAVSVGSRFAGDGPQVDAGQAADVVAELRTGAARSTDLVRDFTGLDAPDGTAPVLVVDRPGWVRANADGFAKVIEPLAAKMSAAQKSTGVTRAVGSRVTGMEVGLLLGFLGGKVLGQFDPFHDPAGRLLLVAPNIVHVEREIGADPHDFRLWVCLHEETHRVQFTAVPWMREHLFAQVSELGGSVEPSELAGDLFQRVAEIVRGEGREGAPSLLELMSSPAQREVIDKVTGMMSLLEGHADVVMDGVGPSVIPSVSRIRESFDKRRQGVGVLDRLLRRLIGLDAKMAQYRDGAKFVRAVVDHVGMADFNAVWAGPENLPTRAEIHDPSTWVARVHG